MPNKPIKFEFEADTDKFERSMKDAASDTEKLEKAIKDIPKATDKMADQAEDDFDRIGDEAADAGKEAGQEFQQNLGESVASGNLEDLLTDTLGGLVASLSGPLGLAAAGVAGVAALAFNKLREEWEKTQEAIKEQTESMWGTILAGVEGQIGESFARINKATVVNEELDRLWNDDPEGMLKLVEASEKLGVSAKDVARARAGDEEALKRVKGEVDGILETMDLTTAESVEQIDAAREIQKGWEVSEQAVAKAKTQVDAYNASVGAVEHSLKRLPNEIPIKIKLDTKSLGQFAGGAYQTSSGDRFTAKYGE